MRTAMRHLIACAALGCMALTAFAAEPGAPHSMGGSRCEKSPYNCADTPNPLSATTTVWLEEMTWMDVRDALAAGKKTIIIPTGGIEPNGPWVALGKHDYVLRATCDAIVRKLGNALCGPIVPFVPEGDLESKSGHMDSPGTISVHQEVYEGLIADIARSMKAAGFENILFISDNGGSNQAGEKAVAERLNKEWGVTIARYIPEYYASWDAADSYLWEKGIWKKEVRDGIHDDPSVELIIMQTNPALVRWEERVKAHKATINGVSIEDKQRALEWGKELVERRASLTAAAITKAVASKGQPQ